VVIGPGGIGSAVAHELQQQARHGPVWCLGRRTEPALDYAREDSLAQSAAWVAQHAPGIRVIPHGYPNAFMEHGSEAPSLEQ
jgi:hypothetical protein